MFSGTQLQHRFPVGLLQLLDLLLVLLTDVQRVGTQRVLHAPLRLIDPGLDL